MDTYSISDDSLAILLPRREELDVGAAVRLMLRLAGLKPWDAVEAELYVLGENMLPGSYTHRTLPTIYSV